MKKLPIFLTAIVAACFGAEGANASIMGGRFTDPYVTQYPGWVSAAEALTQPEEGLNILSEDFFSNNILDLGQGIADDAPPESYVRTPEVKRAVNGFNEVQGYVLADDLPVELIPGVDLNTQNWSNRRDNPYSLAAGTAINSHFFFYWPQLPADQVDPRWGGNNVWLQVDLEFENTILGVMGDGVDLAESNSFLGLDSDSVLYPDRSGFSIDTRGYSSDDVVLSISDNMMSIYLNVATIIETTLPGDTEPTISATFDFFRVFTAVETTEVPEPLTILGSTAAVLWGGFLKKQKRKK